MRIACRKDLALTRFLCVHGAQRVWPDGSAEQTANLRIRKFLQETRGFLNPLEYSEHLAVDEAKSWLRNERLRNYPRITRMTFIDRDSQACKLIGSALVWSKDVHSLFPASCRSQATEFRVVFCMLNKGRTRARKGELPEETVELLLSLVIDRWG